MVVETEHQVVAVEVKSPVLVATVLLGGVVSALISEESDMGHKAETIREVERYTRAKSDTIFNSSVSMGTSDAEVDTSVDEEVQLTGAEICITGIRSDFKYGLFFIA